LFSKLLSTLNISYRHFKQDAFRGISRISSAREGCI